MSAVSYDMREIASDTLIQSRFRRRFWRAVSRAALDRFREDWPFDTGLSLRSWGQSEDGRTVFNTADYASFVWESAKNGGPPGIAERTWRAIKAGAISGELDRIARKFGENRERDGLTALERYEQRIASRGQSLADVIPQQLQPRASPATLSRGGAVFDPIAATQGALAAAAPASLPAAISTAPAFVGAAQRTILLDLLATIAPSAPRAVIQALQRGRLREAAELLAASGRADVAQALIRRAR